MVFAAGLKLISAHCNTFQWTVKEIPSFVNVPLDMLFNLIYILKWEENC